jgi:hypothetical protein
MFGFWAWNQHRRRHEKIHTPEFLMAGDVLSWDSADALGERFLIAGLLFGCEFALRVSEEIGAVAAQSEH